MMMNIAIDPAVATIWAIFTVLVFTPKIKSRAVTALTIIIKTCRYNSHGLSAVYRLLIGLR